MREPPESRRNAFDASDLRDRPLLRAFLREQFGSAAIDLTVHRNDEMLTPSPSIDQQSYDHQLVLYFQAGLTSFRAIEQVARWRFGSLDRVGSVLDFAAGFGRVSRFLSHRFGPQRVVVSEILEEAVDFQQRTFGVTAIQSSTEPGAFECARMFDVVFVASLFSHLPERTFNGWLKRLWDLVAPGGLLLFSVHNEDSFRYLNPAGLIAGGGDFVFAPSRWSRYISPENYGNTLVSDAYLAAAIARATDGRPFVRIPYGLSSFQDLCVVARADDVRFDSLNLDHGPEGDFEGFVTNPDGTATARGWTASRNRACPVERIRITVAGSVVAEVEPSVLRPEVNANLRIGDARRTGWSASMALPEELDSEDIVQIRAVTAAGLDWLQYIGTVREALRRPIIWAEPEHLSRLSDVVDELDRGQLAARVIRLERTNAALLRLVGELEGHRAGLSARLAGMRSSRFWKARSAWFAMKRRLRLTDEEP